MKEEIQIEQAARLAGKTAPENISTERARTFVSGVMGEKKRSALGRLFFERPALAWGGSAFAFAVAAALAFVVFVPTGGQSASGVQVQELQSVHASSEIADTSCVSSADSLDTFELPVAPLE